MTTSRLTEDQQLAVQFDRQANLLLSAAAGSGKTTTLTERIVDRMLKGIVLPSELLVITFTELAAKDLKVKIERRLNESRDKARTKKERLHCDRLLNELELAQISTIHAFCQQILNAYLSEFCDAEGRAFLEPGFRVMDQEEERQMSEEALDAVLGSLYGYVSDDEAFTPFILAGGDKSATAWLADFRAVARAYSPDLDDKNFREAISNMLDLLRNLPHYIEQSKTSLEALFHRINHFPDPADKALLYWWDLYGECLAEAQAVIASMTADPFLHDVLASSSLKTDRQLADAVYEAAQAVLALEQLSGHDAAHWDGIHDIGKCLGDVSLPAFSGGANLSFKNEEKNEWIEQYREHVLPLLALISDRVKRTGRDASFVANHPPVFSSSCGDIRASLATTADQVARFMETVLLVDEEFKKRRFTRNAIQFSDMEHGALQLLQDPAIQDEYRSRYKEVYVDEYQDTSSIQDAIIQKVSDNNRLAVGDIKQSIYRFRYANPALFSHHERNSRRISAGKPVPALDEGEVGYLALLNRCFRTRPKIIDFINDFFSAFLTESSGEIEYDETQALIPDDKKWQHLDTTTHALSLFIATSVKNQFVAESAATANRRLEEMGALSPAAREAFLAVDIIRKLSRQGVRHEQIAILLPSNDDCRQYEEILALSGIPVTTRSGRRFPDSFVFSQVEALLSLLDNPRQDIPLLSMLIGPFCPDSWSAEELMEVASITLDAPSDTGKPWHSYFHDRFFSCVEHSNEPLADKARAFIARVDRWRFLARELDPKELLELIFFETDYAYYLANSQYAESYLSELDRLLDMMATPDMSGKTGIRSALAKLGQRGEKEDTSRDAALLPRAVRVLTRHRSKGLEWDYVILGRLDSRWKLLDKKPIVYFTEAEGLTSATIAEDGVTVTNNPIHQATLLAEERRARAESWRLLYVAMTRAIHGLYLLLSTDRPSLGDRAYYAELSKRVERHMKGLTDAERKGRAIMPASLSTATRNDAELLMSYLAARFPDTYESILSTEQGECEKAPFDHIVVKDWNDLVKELLVQGDDKTDETKEMSHVVHHEGEATVFDLLHRPVPHEEAATAPSKITVTELQRLGLESEISLYAEPPSSEPVYAVDTENGARLVTGEMSLTMRAREDTPSHVGSTFGTAMHTVFRFLDLRKLRTAKHEEAIERYAEELARMRQEQTLTEEERQAATSLASQVVLWAKSSLAARILHVDETTGRLYREMPFTLAVPSSRFGSAFPEHETSLVQGMIDLWFVEDDGQAVLVDFKTDRLPPNSAEAVLKERYSIQIDAYSEAIERATGRRVKERIIWLVREARPVLL